MMSVPNTSEFAIYLGSCGGVRCGAIGGAFLGGLPAALLSAVPCGLLGGISGAILAAPGAALRGAVLGSIPFLLITMVAVAMGNLAELWSVEFVLVLGVLLAVGAWCGAGMGAVISLTRTLEEGRTH